MTIVDKYGNPVADANVSGKWNELTSDTDRGLTNEDGKIALNSDSVKNAAGMFNFTVNGVVLSGWIYDKYNNTETSDSITV